MPLIWTAYEATAQHSRGSGGNVSQHARRPAAGPLSLSALTKSLGLCIPQRVQTLWPLMLPPHRPLLRTIAVTVRHAVGTDADWSPPKSLSGRERTGFRSCCGPHNVVAIAPAGTVPLANASVLALPVTTRQVVYRYRSLSNGEGCCSTQTPESWQGTMRRELTEWLDSHTSMIQALIDERLEKLLPTPITYLY